MKKLFSTLILASLLISCSNDNDDSCQSNKDAINLKYDIQIQYVRDHPGPTGIDYRQITLLQQERDNKIANACN
jgi:hypothetical protein